jgi:uncharacterized membrane protein YcaP (DUF421 family)/DNA-directed RNA polymerase subunit RPC12/RpoP
MDQPELFLDLQRMFLGEEPPIFLLEIVIRTTIIYAWSLLLLRWLGSRTIGQLSTIEFLLVIALGSAVGDAMFYPDVPLLHALLVITLVILFNKGLDMLVARSKRAERVLDGMPRELIRDGVVGKAFLHARTMGISELFQELREKGIEHLGQVGRAYVEPDGVLTVYRSLNERPGLPIVPPFEVEPPPVVHADRPAASGADLVCTRCGTLREIAAGASPGLCPHCGNRHWTEARATALFREP